MDRGRIHVVSNIGSWLFRYGKDDIVSVAQNPSSLKTNSYGGNCGLWMFLISPIRREAKFGGYTERFAGRSPGIRLGNNGG